VRFGPQKQRGIQSIPDYGGPWRRKRVTTFESMVFGKTALALMMTV